MTKLAGGGEVNGIVRHDALHFCRCLRVRRVAPKLARQHVPDCVRVIVAPRRVNDHSGTQV